MQILILAVYVEEHTWDEKCIHDIRNYRGISFFLSPSGLAENASERVDLAGVTRAILTFQCAFFVVCNLSVRYRNVLLRTTPHTICISGSKFS